MSLHSRTAALICLLASATPALADQYRSQQRIIEPSSSTRSVDAQTLLKQTADPYQRALLLRELAAAAIERKDAAAAARYLEQALAQKALSPAADEQMRATLSQLTMASGEAGKNLPQLEAQIRSGNAAPETRVILAAAYTRAKRYKDAVPLLQSAVAARQPADPSWERLLAVALIGAERYAEAIPVLERLVRAMPGDRELWRWLTALSQRYGDKGRALVLTEMAMQLGYLDTPNDRLRFAQISAQYGAPYQAALRLESWLENKQVPSNASSLQTLASLWLAAREQTRALAAVDRAIQLQPSIELYRSKARLLMRTQGYAEAARAQQKAIDLGDNSGGAWMALGLAHYYQGLISEAIAAFNRAAQFGNQQSAAQNWLRYLETLR